jgi:hypothetical protein
MPSLLLWISANQLFSFLDNPSFSVQTLQVATLLHLCAQPRYRHDLRSRAMRTMIHLCKQQRISLRTLSRTAQCILITALPEVSCSSSSASSRPAAPSASTASSARRLQAGVEPRPELLVESLLLVAVRLLRAELFPAAESLLFEMGPALRVHCESRVRLLGMLLALSSDRASQERASVHGAAASVGSLRVRAAELLRRLWLEHADAANASDAEVQRSVCMLEDSLDRLWEEVEQAHLSALSLGRLPLAVSTHICHCWARLVHADHAQHSHMAMLLRKRLLSTRHSWRLTGTLLATHVLQARTLPTASGASPPPSPLPWLLRRLHDALTHLSTAQPTALLFVLLSLRCVQGAAHHLAAVCAGFRALASV